MFAALIFLLGGATLFNQPQPLSKAKGMQLEQTGLLGPCNKQGKRGECRKNCLNKLGWLVCRVPLKQRTYGSGWTEGVCNGPADGG